MAIIPSTESGQCIMVFRCDILLLFFRYFFVICSFFYQFCTPSASFPDVPDFVPENVAENFTSNFLIICFLLLFAYYLSHTSGVFIGNIRYIPYNVSLNMLVKTQKKQFLSQDFSNTSLLHNFSIIHPLRRVFLTLSFHGIFDLRFIMPRYVIQFHRTKPIHFEVRSPFSFLYHLKT